MGFQFVKLAKKRSGKVKPDLFALAEEQGCMVCPAKKNGSEIEPGPAKNPEIYILIDFHSRESAEIGLHCSDEIMKKMPETIMKVFGEKFLEESVRFNALAKCFVEGDPNNMALKCCHSKLFDDIYESKPKLIILVGDVVLKTFIPRSSTDNMRGRFFPIRIKDKSFWAVNILHPKTLAAVHARMKFDFETEFDKCFNRDFQKIDDFISDKNFKAPYVQTDGYDDNIELCLDIDSIKRGLDRISGYKSIAVDIETTCLRPFEDDARILMIALGTVKDTIVFPVQFRGHFKTPDQEKVLDTLDAFFKKDQIRIAHNLKFELEWFQWYFGPSVVYDNDWRDTMLESYCMDERTAADKDGNHTNKGSTLGLGILTRLFFGFNIKDMAENVKQAWKSEGLESNDLMDSMRYNGRDTKYTYKLHRVLDKRIDTEQRAIYQDILLESSKSIVMMQTKGVKISMKKLKMFEDQYTAEIKRLEIAIFEDPAVVKAKSIWGEFNPDAPMHVMRMFKECHVKGKEIFGNNPKKTIDKNDLVLLINNGVQLAVDLVKYKETVKLKSTYIDSMKSQISEDGWLRASFNNAATVTGRLASSGPNMQNFPKRKNSEIRNIIVAPKGYVMVACDYGQIEARVIAMGSRDKVWCQGIRDGEDVHKFWAIEILKLQPSIVNCEDFSEVTPEKIKKFRSIVKNAMVFPLFYGASKYSVARNLGLEDLVRDRIYDKFWKRYARVKEWQEEIKAFYDANGYVSTLTGARRHEPMNLNELLNAPIQGTAAHMVITAMNQISEYAYRNDKEQFYPVLNIHDDLTFYIPEESLEEDILHIAKTMCCVNFPFINVPLAVEVSIGKSWGSLKVLKTYSSEDFK